VVALPLVVACSSAEDPPGGGAGTGGTTGGAGGTPGSGGTSGTAGKGGAGGTAGTAAGSGGGAGVGGTAGGGGSAGTAGAAGTSGVAGSAGMSGAAGSSGGMSGAAGSSGGMSGAAGNAGGAGAAGAAGSAGMGGSGGGGTFTLTIEGFTPMAGCGPMAMASSCAVWPRDLQQWMQGPNMSPAMSWTNPPAGTMSFAVSLLDLSNGNEHWVLWNLPANTTMLAEDVPDDMMNQASIGSGNAYFGPGSNCNVYEFTVYALAMAMFSPDNATDPGDVFTELNELGSSALLGKASVRGRQNFSGDCNP
jgi:phosphatidylethanolamine-binding protein (PEBP) family uncharacterized protein